MSSHSGRNRRPRRIGLLTYHRSVNDGSVMQAYSLYQLLRRELPSAEVEIIDYMLGSLHERHRRLALYAYRPPFLNPRYAWSYVNQTTFLRRHCRFSSQRFIGDDYHAAQRFIDAQGYDAIVMGSDNAWELGRPPAPPNVFFRPSRTTPTFAFAPSADPAPVSGSPWLNGAKADLLRADIEAFDVTTVRDVATRDFLHLLGIPREKIGMLPDPTLLWDFEHILDRPARLGTQNRPLAALAASTSLARRLQSHLTAARYETVSLMGARQLGTALSAPMLSSIERRLGMYAFFDLTITDRFHMSIFALKHGRGPVIFLEDEDRWPNQNSKGRDLLTKVGLEAMVWRINKANCTLDNLTELIQRWPHVSRGLPERLRNLRVAAEATGYAGIVPALERVVNA